MQYTIRGIPPEVDAALRERARRTRQNLNGAALQALIVGVGLSGERKKRDLSDLVGTWKSDPEFKTAIAEHDQVDEDLWK